MLDLIYPIRRAWFLRRVRAKYEAHLENHREAFEAFRSGRRVSELIVKGGPTIGARPTDEALVAFWEIFVERCYLRPDFYLPRPQDVILDIGANIGTFSLHCQKLAPGVRVFAAEPNPGTFAQLQANIERNNLGAAVTAFNLALSDHEGTLHIDERSDTSGHQRLLDAGDGVAIPCLTLDQFFERAGIDRCDLLKVDTEGAETAIVEGASRGLWDRVDKVVIEYHDIPGEVIRGEVVARKLTELGYRVRSEPARYYPNLGLIYATKG
jgi:FkbM family methyltransferase